MMVNGSASVSSASRRAENAVHFCASSHDCESPWKGLTETIWSRMLVTSPSTVVNLPPSVPGESSSPSSGISRLAVSDLRTSRERSSGQVTWSVWRCPRGSVAPPLLISVVRYPQLSQRNAMMTTSLKNGMLHRSILTWPDLKQTAQRSGITSTSCGITASSPDDAIFSNIADEVIVTAASPRIRSSMGSLPRCADLWPRRLIGTSSSTSGAAGSRAYS
eukprot:Amastigsp_a841186_137.p4 type:complete len:219 gc:universal Amastigsp_a841186_137:1346-690(-)